MSIRWIMGSSGFDSPGPVLARLDEIEHDLDERQIEYECAARNRAKLVRDWDYRLALHMKSAHGPNAEARKAVALVTAIEQDDLYERLTDAESAFDALRAVIRTMETRASIGQSILRAQGRV